MYNACEVFSVYVEMLWLQVKSWDPDCLDLNANSALP